MLKSINQSKHKAFTIVEILITLGIIGIISTIVIPIMINQTTSIKYKNKAKEAYSIIAQATQNLKINNGGLDNNHSNAQQFFNLYKPYFKYIKECINSSTTGCLGTSYKYLNGTPAHSSWNPVGYPSFILANGSAISVVTPYWYSPTCTTTYSSNLKNVCAQFYLDVNGNLKPNQYGVDMYLIFITKNGAVPAGAIGAEGMASDHICPVYGYSCLARVLNNVNY